MFDGIFLKKNTENGLNIILIDIAQKAATYFFL